MLDVEDRLYTPAAEERWVQIRGQASYRADGTPLAMVGVSQDITERKQIEEHRTMLANELSHRVKNSLAMIQAVIAQTLKHATSLEGFGETLQARVVAMAAANDLLMSLDREGASLRDRPGRGRLTTPARLRLTWRDIGGPSVTPSVRHSFGTRLIERALARETRGEALSDYRPGGVVLSLTAPLTDA